MKIRETPISEGGYWPCPGVGQPIRRSLKHTFRAVLALVLTWGHFQHVLGQTFALHLDLGRLGVNLGQIVGVSAGPHLLGLAIFLIGS